MIPNGKGKLIGDDIREGTQAKLFGSPIEVVEPEVIHECSIALVDQESESCDWHTFRYAHFGDQTRTAADDKPVSFKNLHEIMQLDIKENP